MCIRDRNTATCSPSATARFKVAEPLVAPPDKPVPATTAVISPEAEMLVKFDPSIAGNTEGNLASGIVPDASRSALRLVRFVALTAGNVEGNLSSGTVPDASRSALRSVRFAPLPVGSPVKSPTNDVAVSAPDDELNVRLLPDLGGRLPDAAVVNNTLHDVSDDSSATVTLVEVVAVVALPVVS